jgi:CO dehydrogenase maturation factor
MATTIAISGKGGAGKTTLAAMIIRMLVTQSANGEGVLAVDADPNSCLGLTMGVETTSNVAEIREKTRAKQPSDGGMDRVRSFEYGLQQVITEAKGFDLLAMGQPEGPDCYCAVNNLLRSFLDKLSSAYSFVVVDNEAGMEHLSRRTTNNVDLLCIIAESTPLGMLTAQRIFKLAKQLPISVKEIGMIWNKCESVKELEEVESFGFVPYDEAVFEASMQNKTIFDIEMNSPAFLAVQKILESKLSLKKI